MAGWGFAKHANTIVKENRKLLKKKSLFKKERSFLNLKNEVFYKDSQGIPSKKLSKRERRTYRYKTVVSYRKDRLYDRMIIVLTVFLFFILMIWFYTGTEHKELVNKLKLEKAELTEKMDKYDYYISSGDEWFKKEKYFNAIFQYRLALELFPNDSIATFRFIEAANLNCEIYNNNCGEGQEALEAYKNR